MNKLRVLYVIDTLSIGGAEQSLASILPWYRETESIVCQLYKGDALKPQFDAAGIEAYSLGLTGKYSLTDAYIGLKRVIAHTDPDIVHSALIRSDLVSRLACHIVEIPHITSLVSDSYSSNRYGQMRTNRRRKHYIIQLLDRFTSRYSTHFIANSHSIKLSNSQALGIPLDAISVIYRGRDPRLYSSQYVDITTLRRKLNVTETSKILLNVGRLVPQKNQSTLIRSVTRILQMAPNCHLLIAGEGPERHTLQSLIDQCGLNASISLLGFRSDVPELLQIADAYIFPSYSEGHPGSVVEAMLSNCPVIASDIPVHRETLLDGALGRLFSLKSPLDLGDCVIRALSEPEQTRNLAACARESARQRFDVRVTAGQYERLYERLMVQQNLI